MSDTPTETGAAAPDSLLQHAERVRASGVLGRSGQIRRLFDFLVECALSGRVPKEIEVAIDAFGKGAGFDATQDALVRVYVHKLRRKLDAYYSGPGQGAAGRLLIPRGEYRLVVAAAPLQVRRSALSRREGLGVALIGVLLAITLVLGVQRLRAAGPAAAADVAAARQSPVWRPLLADDRPVEIVLGDYYIFGERKPGETQSSRLVREYDINSRGDLEQRLKQQPELAARYEDLNLGYLPTASAYALRQVLPVLLAAGKQVHITLASELTPQVFKTSHIVYIGYLSALGMLQDVVFAGSRFTVGASFDELIDSVSGTPYVSEAGGPLKDSERYRDYGYVSTFAGPSGNRLVIVAGTRDTAVMQTAEMLTNPQRLAELSGRVGREAAFEALYEVYGVDRTNIEARLLVASALEASAIWSEQAWQSAAGQATAAKSVPVPVPVPVAAGAATPVRPGEKPKVRSHGDRSAADQGRLTQ